MKIGRLVAANADDGAKPVEIEFEALSGTGEIEELGIEPGDATDADRGSVRRNYQEIKEFASGLTTDDLKSGDWFAKLLVHALHQYRDKVDWTYFERKYPNMPRDAIVEARIKLAARYAALTGGLSASAYTGAVAATIGSAGGASPLTGSAAVLSFSADLFSTTTLQLRLAYDIAVLYRIPIDFDDPEDLWRFIRTAFAIKVGEATESAVAKAVPALIRPLIKKLYSGSVLTAAKSLPVIGKHLLQRNVIKFAIPAIGIPASTSVNYWSTRVAGNHARNTYRAEADIREQARRLVEGAPAHRAALWVAWLVVAVDEKINETETTLMRHLISMMDSIHGVTDVDLSEVVTVDRDFVWSLVSEVEDGRSSLHRIGVAAAEVDGKINSHEREVLSELAAHCA
jgi:tellurite resistance protein